ncbi:MAG: NTPase [Crenarchaeota archaeon]|nr:NTPase [Thermoproteota archaeon]
MHRIFLVTGRPGVGKTTLVKKVAETLYGRYLIRGFITQEVREQGSRIGFKLMTIEKALGRDGEEDWLAHVSLFRGGPRIGKYNVNIDAIDNIAIRVLEDSLRQDTDLIVIDEIGPMELLSRKFLPTVEKVLDSDRVVLATIHIKCREDPRLRKIVDRKDKLLVELTLQNRNQMYQIVRHEVEQAIRRFRKR